MANKIEQLIINIIDKILLPENAQYRQRMGLGTTDEELLSMIKEELSYTESVFNIEWEQIPSYVNIKDNSYITLKNEYKPKILMSYANGGVPSQPSDLTKAHDGDYLMIDSSLGVIKLDKDTFSIKETVILLQANSNGYRWYEDNGRITGGRIIPFTTPGGNYYAVIMRVNYGDFVIKVFDEEFNYLWFKRLQYGTHTFANRFSFSNGVIIDYNNVLLGSDYGGDTDGSGTVIGDDGVVYVGKFILDSNDIPTDFDFYRKSDGYPVAFMGLDQRYAGSLFYENYVGGFQNIVVNGDDVYVLHVGKISHFHIITLGDGTTPIEAEFIRVYTTPPEVKDYLVNWTAKDMFFRVENSIPYLYVVISNPPIYYGIAKVRLDTFRLVSFVGSYLYTYGTYHWPVYNSSSITSETDEQENYGRTMVSGTTFGNIVGSIPLDNGILVLDYGNRDLKIIPYELFDTVGTVAISKEYTVPKTMEITKVIVGSPGKYYISINNGDWMPLENKFMVIQPNTPFKFKRKFYAYELLHGDLDISLKLIVQ